MSSGARSLVCLGAFAVVVGWLGGMGRGQEEEQPSTPGVTEAPAAIADSRFAEVMEEFKATIKGLRELQLRFQTSEADALPAMQEQWNQLQAKGNEQLLRLRDVAVEDYKKSPNQDAALVRFLVDLTEDYVLRDDYEPAFEIGKVLIENKCDILKIYELAGTAAFCLHEFDLAVQYLQEAQNAGVLEEKGAEVLAAAKDYQTFWPEEKALREAEAMKDDLPKVKLQTTKGDIELELFEDQAPGAVGNMISLIEKGFYDGLTFHRVLGNFMAQGGCPQGDGSGGPGYSILDEFANPGARKHYRGSLSMAKTAAPNSGGSQFFLTFRPTPHLNGQHTVFGRVLSGWDVLVKLQRRDPSDPAAKASDKIVKAEVVRKRPHEYAPNKAEAK